MDALLTHASQIYGISYFGVLIAVALLEQFAPRRDPGKHLALRWTNNVGITVLDTFVLRAILPMAGVAWAALCRERGWGFFNQTAWPSSLEVIVSVLALDLLLYSQHYLLHRVPLLWRIHRTHHSDHDYDFSTGLRFHPLEALFTSTLQLGVILALGAPPSAVFLSQVLAAVATFIEHANVRIPPSIDCVLRLIVVTPDMHRIHHSQRSDEGRSNLSTAFSWWDRLFGTYVDQPIAGHEGIQFGLQQFPDRKHATLPWMLVEPFLPERKAVGQETTPFPLSLRDG